eukprot:TRINITY_DN7959_c2_g1_i1.p1 TRINITY_DN7959_c2_g1~~TRINITY_DN7959_c2_g1_i1.p1  ORF type:complete len:1260 (+),score=225.02 TRINITY_DN7959_c2_g1_i1:75-3854(+)
MWALVSFFVGAHLIFSVTPASAVGCDPSVETCGENDEVSLLQSHLEMLEEVKEPDGIKLMEDVVKAPFNKLVEGEICGRSDVKAFPTSTLSERRRARRRWRRGEAVKEDCEAKCRDRSNVCKFYYVNDYDCHMFATCNHRVTANDGAIYGDALPTTTTTTTTIDPSSRRRGVLPDKMYRWIVYGSRTTRDGICSGTMPGHAECIITADALGGSLPFVVVFAKEAELEELTSGYDDVDLSEIDVPVSVGPYEFDPESVSMPESLLWNLDRLDSRGVTAGVDGSFLAGGGGGRSVHAYIVDSGILAHNEFGYRMIPTLDINDDGVPYECGINGLDTSGVHSYECAHDSSGHGTHVAGTVGGNNTGVANQVTLHAMRVVRNDKVTRMSGVLAALHWIAANGERPAVVGLDIQAEFQQTEGYRRAMSALEAAGVTVVIPAGNRRGINGPADACESALETDKAVTVGAIGKTYVDYHYHADYFADFSNYGQCVDILAPGVSIVTTSSLNKNGFFKASGTSLASAHAVGVIARILGMGDISSPQDVRSAVLNEAEGLHRRRREPSKPGRRRVTQYRPLGETPDKVLYVKLSTNKIHRRREPSNLRRRRTPAPAPPKPEATPTKTLSTNNIPIYGPAQASGRWLVNFKLPPKGFEYYKSSYSRTLAWDFCANLTGSAACIFKGRPAEGGTPFVVLTATESELEAILDRYDPKALYEYPAVEFVEADTRISAIPEAEVDEEPEETRATAYVGRRRRGLSWGLDRIDSMHTLDGAYMVSRSGGFKSFAADFNHSAQVYVLDTGVRTTHKDFQGRATPALDLTSGCLRECESSDTACAADGHGHGTHVAAVVAGSELGVAKRAAIHAVKVLDDSGEGWLSWTMVALDWIGRKGLKPNVAVLNAEGVGASRSMQRAVDFANLMAEITVVVGAGSAATEACEHFPANVETVGGIIGAGAIVFGATTQSDTIAEYSNYGSCVDYLAPGSAILTASHLDDDSQVTVSGTSLASAHGAGAAALLLASEKAVNPARVDIFLHLDSFLKYQIDIRQEKHKNTKNQLINVREAAMSPVPPAEDTECYTCQHTRSGCACMKEWEYQFDGKKHTCDNYCCNPYDSPIGAWCKTIGPCTVRVRGKAPERRESDFCDTVPGRRTTGGWLEKPYIYEDDSFPTPAPAPEETCASPNTPKGPPAPAPAPAVDPAGPAPNPAPAPVPGSAPAPAVDPAPGATPSGPDAIPAGAFTGTPEPEEVVARVEADVKCLEKRLAGLPCP